MLRQAEELVMEARLEQIAREHKSMGAVLDTRTLYPLEEIKFQTKRSLRVEIEKRLQGRRGGRAETDIKSKANLAVEAFKERGINVSILTGNYELEQKIWRNKASKKNYAQRRHLHYPELDEFLNSMSTNQVIEYQNRISQKLVELVEKYRKECADLKSEMDLNGIFHPDANAQRAHCIYLMKLEKGISSSNIEDPVLKKMYIEEYDRQCQELDVQVKKQQMIKDLEDEELQSNTNRRPDSKPSAPVNSENFEGTKDDNILSMMDATEKKEETMSDIDELKNKIVKLKPFQEKVYEKRDLSKSKWLPKIKLPLQKSQSAHKVNVKEDRSKRIVHSSSGSAISEHFIQNSKLDSMVSSNKHSDDSECNELSGGFGKAAPSSPTKLFSKKLKHERMGYMDPRSILGDEAAKLDAAEPHVSRKVFDKNSLLDDSMSKWMLTEVQKTQIMKASSGGISNGVVKPTLSSLVDDVPPTYATPGCFSPQKILPFDEFYSLLNTVAEEPIPKQKEAIQISPQKRQGKLSIEDSGLQSASELRSSELFITPEPINIVKHLMEKDKHFEAFLKMNEREQPSSKLLEKLNASILKPRRQRKVPQLGKEAVTLSDSRGQPSKMASKGFPNMFVPNTADSKDSITESKVKVGIDVNMVKNTDIGEPPDVIERLLLDAKDGRKNKDCSSGSNFDGHGFDDIPMKFPHYISKAKAGNNDSKVNREEALSFIRTEFRDCVDDTMFSFDEQVDIDMQNKLLACWEALSAPMHDRLNFMDKYSSFAYAAEMSRAVDIWSEVAVLVTLLSEALSLHKKLEANLMIFPIPATSLVKQLIRKIHPLLAASAPCLVPPIILYDNQMQSIPLSVAAMVSTRDLINSTIAAQNMKTEIFRGENDRHVLQSSNDAETAFVEILSQLSNDLIASLKRCHRELEDVVPFGTVSCKEWVISLPIKRHGDSK